MECLQQELYKRRQFELFKSLLCDGAAGIVVEKLQADSEIHVRF